MKKYNVGLVGVGAVGSEMIKVLKERSFPCGKVQVFASRERDEEICGEKYHVLKADENSAVKWFDPNAAIDACSEPWMRPVYRRLNERMKDF